MRITQFKLLGIIHILLFIGIVLTQDTTDTTTSDPDITVVGQVLADSNTTVTYFSTTDCFNGCVNNNTDWFFCSHARDYGYCCQDNSTTECQTSETNEIYCSKGVDNSFMHLTYCPRKTSPCVTPGPLLRPLLNKNQSVSLINTMNASNGDVCYWQLKVDLDSFQSKHPSVAMSDVFINLVVTVRSNMITHTLQGYDNKLNATNASSNATVGNVFKYPLSEGHSIYLIAHPENMSAYLDSQLNFTFNITADYYPMKGMTAQLQADILPDISKKGFWIFIEVGAAIGILILVLVMFFICCRDFDPENDFEKRRRKLNREKKIKDKKDKKDKAKEEKSKKKPAPPPVTKKAKKVKDEEDDSEDDSEDDKKKKKAATPKKGTKGKNQPEPQSKKGKKAKSKNSDEDEYEEDSSEDDKKKKKANAKKAPIKANDKKPVKKSLETEIKLKDDKNKHKDDFKMPLLEDSDND